MKTDFIKIIGVMLLMGMFACTQAPKSDEAAASAPKSEMSFNASGELPKDLLIFLLFLSRTIPVK